MYISVIIPVYNAERTIERAVCSVLSQSFDDYEILAINDGSQDDSASILDALTRKTPKLRVITVPNAGVSAARNRGIQEAQGKYIMFMDSDDMLAPDIMHTVHARTTDFNPDIFVFGFVLTDEAVRPIKEHTHRSGQYQDGQALTRELASLYKNNQLNMVWNKALRTAWVKEEGLSFQQYQYGEDRLFVFDALDAAQRVEVSDIIGYTYIVNLSGSLISRFHHDKFEICCMIDERIRTLASRHRPIAPEDAALYDYMFIKSAISCMVQLHDSSCKLSFSEKLHYIRDILKHPRVLRKRGQFSGGGISYAVLSYLMRTCLSLLNYLTSYFIHIVKNRRPGTFVRLKHR